MNKVARFGLNLLILLDEIGNTLTLGSPNETISSRANKGRRENKKFWTLIANTLDWISPGHCARAEAVSVGQDAIVKD